MGMLPVAPEGARDDPPLLLHAASMAAPVVIPIAYLAKFEIFIEEKLLRSFYE
jgi:hypothetical protein